LHETEKKRWALVRYDEERRLFGSMAVDIRALTAGAEG
jgi:hypothetical protein